MHSHESNLSPEEINYLKGLPTDKYRELFFAGKVPKSKRRDKTKPGGDMTTAAKKLEEIKDQLGLK